MKADYDAAFGNFNVPLLPILGFGRDFWLGAGYTLDVTSMTITDASGSAAWSHGGFPNTNALGVNMFRIRIGSGALVFPSELTCTLNGPVNPVFAAFGQIASFFLGLKVSVGVVREMKL